MNGQEIDDLKQTGMTWAQLGQHYNDSPHAIRSYHRRWLEKGKVDSKPYKQEKQQPTPIEFLDKKERVPVSWRDITEAAVELQGYLQDIDGTQRTATLEIKSDRPVPFIYTADWHFGDGYTNHGKWRRDMGLVIDHPLAKMVSLGDSRQNARAFNNLSVVLGQVIPPQLQAAAMENLVDELTASDTLAALVDGNHDDFDEKILGENIQSYLVRKMKAPRFINRGILTIKVGGQTYTNLLFHKSRFSSFLNAVHNAKREYQLSFPADVVAGAHDHQPGFEFYYHYALVRELGYGIGGESFLMKVGSYQDSNFGWKYFHDGGAPYSFGVVYWPDKNKKLIFPTIQDTLYFIDKM